MKSLEILLFDADDTLWENNVYYLNATRAIYELITETGISEHEFGKRFYELEHQFVQREGYGTDIFIKVIRAYMSELEGMFSSNNKATEIDRIISDFLERFNRGPNLFPGVRNTIDQLANDYELYILTKGHFDEQRKKIQRSGIKQYFADYFIVSEKNDKTYQELLGKNKWSSYKTCMIGNSPKSDINPALRCGLHAIYIPYAHTWILDNEEVLQGYPRLNTIKRFEDLVNLLL